MGTLDSLGDRHGMREPVHLPLRECVRCNVPFWPSSELRDWRLRRGIVRHMRNRLQRAGGPCRLRDLIGCDAGCDRMYWGEWAYDPPEPCDPCDDCGNWVGPQDCAPRGFWCLLGLFQGHRYQTPCGDPTCSECEGAIDSSYGAGSVGGPAMEEFWSDESVEVLESTPATTVPRAEPPNTGSVLRESRRPQPTKHPASRVVRRTRTANCAVTAIRKTTETLSWRRIRRPKGEELWRAGRAKRRREPPAC